MNNLEVTVETTEDARFCYLEVDEIVVLDGTLFLVSKKEAAKTAPIRRGWFGFGSKSVQPASFEANIVAVFARGTWRFVFRKESEKSAARATVEKVSHAPTC